jgi:hypothetical protein
MDGVEFEAHLGPYMEWRAACQRYARHLEAGMYGGDCLATDTRGVVWMFAFRPAEDADDGGSGVGGKT